MEWLLAGMMIALGLWAVWLLYSQGLREYLRKGDDDAANVTMIAMFGTFLPFLAFAMACLTIGIGSSHG